MEVTKHARGFALQLNDAVKLTPKKNPLVVPTLALAEAIAHEWEGAKAFSPRTMPLTMIAYTALDVIAHEREGMVEGLLAYAETDLLCYRSEHPELLKLEEAQWQPVVEFLQTRYDCHIEVGQGVTPLDQPEHTVAMFKSALEAMGDFSLAAFAVLVQLYGSLMLALAVVEKGIAENAAWAIARVDEDFQAKQWGVDEQIAQRAVLMQKETEAAIAFLNLLDQN